VLHGTGFSCGAAELCGGGVSLCADWDVHQGAVLIGATDAGNHLVGGGEFRFRGMMRLLGGDQAVGMAPPNAVGYVCFYRCHTQNLNENQMKNQMKNQKQYILRYIYYLRTLSHFSYAVPFYRMHITHSVFWVDAAECGNAAF
jgi:hypothetical protein